MSRGDEFPRYTYMMDFNPMDEDTPLRDYWQTTDVLDNEDAATIASLATQVLQSKAGYEYGEGIEVNEPALVANYMYSESRSSPQSQYSTTMPAEPAESFRGLMEDHDRGARMLEENGASDYDFGAESRGHVSTHSTGNEETTTFSREHYATGPFSPTLSATGEVNVADQNPYTREIEMSAAMTASRVVNGVLRRSYAGTPTEEVVNLQALQAQAPQLTPSHSESRSVSVESSHPAEHEKEPIMEVDEQHADAEPEDVLTAEGMQGEEIDKDKDGEGTEHEEEERAEDQGDGDRDGDEPMEVERNEPEELQEDKREEMEKDEREENEKDEAENLEEEGVDEEEPTPDSGAQQQLITESIERSEAVVDDDDDERLPQLQQTPRKRGRPRGSDAAEATSVLATERSTVAQIAVRENDSHAETEVVEPAPADDSDLNRADKMPTERKRGRPRKSDISEPTTDTAPTPAKRRPGRPPKTMALESTVETRPASGKRGRPRRSSMAVAESTSTIALELSTALPSTATTAPGKRGRPRKIDVMQTAEISTSSAQLPVAGAVETGGPPGNRGRPRDIDVWDIEQAFIDEDQRAAITPARSLSRRGRSRMRDVWDVAQASTDETHGAATATSRSLSRRGRSRKRDIPDTTQRSTDETHGAATATSRSLSKRGRSRKRDMLDTAQRFIEETQEAAPAPAPAPARARSSSRRGRPPRRDVPDTPQEPIDEPQRPATARARSPSKRGRSRRRDVLDVSRDSLDEVHDDPIDDPQRPATARTRSPSRIGRPQKRDVPDTTQDLIHEPPQRTMTARTRSPSRVGRLRKRDVPGATQDSIDEPPQRAVTARARSSSRRGRPRNSDVRDRDMEQASTDEAQRAATVRARSSSRRGRPRKRDVLDAVQASANIVHEAAVTIARASSNRGRSPDNDVLDAVQAFVDEIQEAVVTMARALNKGGQPRENDMLDAAQTSTDKVQEATAIAAQASSRRGGLRKSNVMGEAQTSTEEPESSAVEASTAATPAPSKRGRPRRSDMMSATPAQAPIHDGQLPTVEALVTTTPASGERRLPPKASIASLTTTPGPSKRGRPPKSTAPLAQAERESLPTEEAAQAVESPITRSTGRRGRPPRKPLASEERAVSPTPLSTKKRGRGRPPKNAILLPAELPNPNEEPGLGMDALVAEPQEPSRLVDDVSKDLAVGETAPVSAHEDVEATPTKKRGRPKAAAVDKPLPVMDMLVTASSKKRDRRLTAKATIDSAKERERPVQLETHDEGEEEPAAKRRRTNNDIIMEDAVDESDTREETHEDELPGVEELTNAISVTGKLRKRSSVTWAQPISSTLTEPKAATEPSPRVDGRSRLSGGMQEDSTRTKQVEQTSTVPKPKTLFDMISDGRRMGRQKTYGKRSKR